MKYDHNEETYCLTCGELLEGRLGKMYCDKTCNNNFNNPKRRKKEKPTRSFIKQFQNSQRSLELNYPESKGKKYVNLTNLIQNGLDLSSPCTKFKAEQFPHELTRIANYAYHIDQSNHTILIFKL